MEESAVFPRTQNDNASIGAFLEKEVQVEEKPGKDDEKNAPAHNRRYCDELPPYVEPQRSGSPAARKPEKRYLLRQVPKRLALQPKRRHGEEQR